MIQAKDISAIGKFQKTHALKGELNAIIDIDPAYVSGGNPLVVDVDGIFVPFYAESVRTKGATSFLIKLDGIDSEAEARTFVNKTIYSEKSRLADFLELDEEELLDEADLVGYEILDSESGVVLGTVAHVDDSTDNVLLVVDTPSGDEIYIPAVDQFITDVDNDNRIIRVSLPDGLVDLNEKKPKD